ncbi:hypothetical protein Gotri_022328 [Gossypium trilobum]|uniref:Uncharacterized protein n=1 Tax=Gossypium trilobum TaxID=34281 RepID=A0A7J9DFK8_9ROSI|nr:hypothetical protein [Gossypium trilobum]
MIQFQVYLTGLTKGSRLSLEFWSKILDL